MTCGANKFVVYSFPRSGRNLLADLLENQGLSYMYVDSNTEYPEDIDFLMSHDFWRPDIVSEIYPNRDKIVLVREPISCFCSWFELDTKKRPVEPQIPDTVDMWRARALGGYLSHFKHFAKLHWINPLESTIICTDDIFNKQETVVKNLCSFANVEYRDGLLIEPNPPRVIEDFRYYDAEFFAELKRRMQPEYDIVMELIENYGV